MGFHLWRQLKKRLRRGRRPLWSLGGLTGKPARFSRIMAAAAIAAWLTALPLAGSGVFAASSDETRASVSYLLQELKASGEKAEVVLHRIYVCGEETESLGRMNADEIVALIVEHPGWSAMAERDGSAIRLEQAISDLSPHCKSHAHFGIDRFGRFTLFDGEPKGEKVLRTFFQLDIQFMESCLPVEELERLSRGIRVSDIDEFNSVLSTFSDFARNGDSQKTMQSY